MDRQDGEFVGHCPCIKCNSSDALAVYKKVVDGNEIFDAYCWSCKQWSSNNELVKSGIVDSKLLKYDREDIMSVEEQELVQSVLKYDVRGMRERSITKTTCNRYGVRCEYDDGRDNITHYYFPATRDGELVGWKVRKLPKEFYSLGQAKSKDELFGQHLFNKGGKFLVITEGQEDALAMYQSLSSDKYETPVVSIQNGVGSAAAQIRANFEWVTSFEKVIIAFDNDSPGQGAVEDVVKLLKPGQAYILKYSEYKDACEYIKHGRGSKLKDLFWKAEKVSPAGVIGSSQTLQYLKERASFEKVPLPVFAEDLQNMLNGGLALGEITTIAAASSVGKTTVVNEFLYHFIFNSPYKVGVISLESDIGELTENLMSIHISKKLANMPDEDKLDFYETIEFTEAHRELTTNEDGTDRYYILDHQGATVDDELKKKIDYLVKGLGCKCIVLDPLTLALSGAGNDGMDLFMSDLLRFVKREKIAHINIVHVRKNSGGNKANSTGADIHEEDMKGCLDAYSEYLSPEGWQRIDEYTGGLVAQWENGVVKFVQPEAYMNLPATEPMYRFYNSNSLDMVLSGEHRMLLGNTVRYASDVAVNPSRAEVPTKFTIAGKFNDSAHTRLLVACAADACYYGNGLAKAEFRKARKVERFRHLLTMNNIVFTETVDTDGDTTFRFKALTEHKHLDKCLDWYAQSSDTLEELLDECTFWDGTVSKRDGERVYYTANKKEADVIQFAAHATGHVARIRSYDNYYHVSIAKNGSPKNKVMLRGDSCKIERVMSSDGRKYCFTVPSGFFVARHNDRVFITGNSGSIFQVSMNNILLMRDKENDDPVVRNTTKVVVSKNRRCGNTGKAGYWYYDNVSSRLSKGSDPHAEYDSDLDEFEQLGAFNDTDSDSKESLRSNNTGELVEY